MQLSFLFLIYFSKLVSAGIVIESITPTYDLYTAANGSIVTNRIDTLTLTCTTGDTGVISGNDGAYSFPFQCPAPVYAMMLNQVTYMFNNTITASATACELAADVPLAQSYEVDIASLGPEPSLDRTVNLTAQLRAGLYRRQSTGDIITGGTAICEATDIFPFAGLCQAGEDVNLQSQIDTNSAAIQQLQSLTCPTAGSLPNPLNNSQCTNVFQSIQNVATGLQQQGQELQGNVTMLMNNITNVFGYVNQSLAAQAVINNDTQAQIANLSASLVQGLSAAQAAINTTNSALSNLTGQLGTIDASLYNATALNSANIAAMSQNLAIFQNQTAQQFAYEDQQRAELAANLTNDLQSLYSTMTTDMQNAFEALREDSQRNNVILAIRLSRAISVLEQSISNASTQIQNLYNYRQMDYTAINALYQTTTTVINDLYDISTIVTSYHNMLATVKASGYTPLLVSEGLLPLNNSDYFLLGIRTFNMTNIMGCTANNSNFIQRYYEGDPCTRPGASTALCNSSDISYGQTVDSIINTPILPMEISLNQQTGEVVQDPACSTIFATSAAGNMTTGQIDCFANSNQCFWLACGVTSGQCIQALYDTTLYNTTSSGLVANYTCPSGGSATVFYDETIKNQGCFQLPSGISTVYTDNAQYCSSYCAAEANRYAVLFQGNQCGCVDTTFGLVQVEDTLCTASIPQNSNAEANTVPGGSISGLYVNLYFDPVVAFGGWEWQDGCLYSGMEDCLSDERCAWMNLQKTGVCVTQSDTSLMSYCGEQGVACSYGEPWIYSEALFTTYDGTYWDLYQNGVTDAQMLNNSLQYQEYNLGQFPCQDSNYPFAFNNYTSCCAVPISAAGACLGSSIDNVFNPYNDWSDVCNATSGGGTEMQFNITYACYIDNGTYTCLPYLDEISLASLGYAAGTTYYDIAMGFQGAWMRYRQIHLNAEKNYFVAGCPLFGCASDVNGTDYYTQLAANPQSAAFEVFGREYQMFYGTNISTSLSITSQNDVATIASQFGTVDFNAIVSGLVNSDLQSLVQQMTTFYGSNPAAWGATIGYPVVQTQTPPEYLSNNVKADKCNFANFAAFQDFIVPVYQVATLIGPSTGCGGQLGNNISSVACSFVDPLAANIPLEGSYLVHYVSADDIVYSPPFQLIQLIGSETTRRGSLTYIHTYNQTSLDIPTFYAINPTFDPSYAMPSLAQYRGTVNSSSPWCSINPANDPHASQFGTNFGLCALSNYYNITNNVGTNDSSLRVIFFEPYYANLTMTFEVNFTSAGIDLGTFACPTDLAWSCSNSVCALTGENMQPNVISVDYSLSGNASAGCAAQSGIITVPASSSDFPTMSTNRRVLHFHLDNWQQHLFHLLWCSTRPNI